MDAGARILENVDIADAHLTLISIQRRLSIDAVVSKTTSDKLRKQISLTPDELIECLLDRIAQLKQSDGHEWSRVASAAKLSLRNAVELARHMVGCLWDEVSISAEERAASLDMSRPESQYSEELLHRLRLMYENLWNEARPKRIVSAVTDALVVAFCAFKLGTYGEAEHHAAFVKVWGSCIQADIETLTQANKLRMQGSDRHAESLLCEESILLSALHMAESRGVGLRGPVLQDALAVGPIRGGGGELSTADLRALVEACWQLN